MQGWKETGRSNPNPVETSAGVLELLTRHGKNSLWVEPTRLKLDWIFELKFFVACSQSRVFGLARCRTEPNGVGRVAYLSHNRTMALHRFLATVGATFSSCGRSELRSGILCRNVALGVVFTDWLEPEALEPFLSNESKYAHSVRFARANRARFGSFEQLGSTSVLSSWFTSQAYLSELYLAVSWKKIKVCFCGESVGTSKNAQGFCSAWIVPEWSVRVPAFVTDPWFRSHSSDQASANRNPTVSWHIHNRWTRRRCRRERKKNFGIRAGPVFPNNRYQSYQIVR